MNNPTLSRKAFLGAAIGTLVEYYDYALFSTFLPIMSPVFFPADSFYQSLVKGYYVFLIAMIARPFGGILFGYLGDVLGRPKALLASMYGIALSTIIIGATPSYTVIGGWALFIVMIAKTIQMACFGGEYNGAGIYVVEHAQNKREALTGSLLTAVMLCGALAASLMGIVLTYSFMPTWSWRIAFALGGLIGVFGILYRKNLAESPHFIAANLHCNGLMELIKQFPRELLAGIFIGGLATAPFSTVLLFVLPVLTAKGFISNHQFMLIQCVLVIFAILTFIPAGIMADKKSPVTVIRFSCCLLIIFAYPMLSVVDKGSLFAIIVALAVIVIINEIFLGPSNAYLKNKFPMQYRYRGSSLSFCIGMSLLGGLTPIAENYLYKATGQFGLTACWLIVLGLGALLSLEWVRRKQKTTVFSTILTG